MDSVTCTCNLPPSSTVSLSIDTIAVMHDLSELKATCIVVAVFMLGRQNQAQAYVATACAGYRLGCDIIASRAAMHQRMAAVLCRVC